MKTVSHIKQQIENNNKRLKSFDDLKKSELNKLIKTNAVLLDLKTYLESNPKEEYIISEKKRIKKIILAKQSQFDNWWSNTVLDNKISPDQQKRLFCKETGITKLRKQLKNLNFLLNENQEQPAFR